MMHKYIGSDVTSMVTLPVIIFEPMTMIQKMAEVSIIASENVLCLLFDIECSDIWCLLQLLEYSHLLDLADECQDPYMRLVYACKCLYFVRQLCRSLFIIKSTFLVAASWAISVYFAYQRTWKPFNPILGETYEMVNHGGITFIAEQVNFDLRKSSFFFLFLFFKTVSHVFYQK